METKIYEKSIEEMHSCDEKSKPRAEFLVQARQNPKYTALNQVSGDY